MRPKKAPPEEGGKIDHETFILTTPKPGTKGSTSGWCACEPWWGMCHDYHEIHGYTKVCLKWFTDGALHCARCKKQPTTERMAYALWWREEDMQPCFTIARNKVWDLMKDLKFGDPILVGRIDEFASPFLKSGSGPRFRSDHPLRKKEVDIMHTLLKVWGYTQLDEWWLEQKRKERRGEVTDVPQPGEQRLSVPDATQDDERGAIDAHRRGGHLGPFADALDDLDEASERAAQRNGKHKREGEGS